MYSWCQHVPVLYLGLDQDISEECIPGTNSWLPGEDDTKMIPLSMIKNCWGEQVFILSNAPLGRHRSYRENRNLAVKLFLCVIIRYNF